MARLAEFSVLDMRPDPDTRLLREMEDDDDNGGHIASQCFVSRLEAVPGRPRQSGQRQHVGGLANCPLSSGSRGTDLDHPPLICCKVVPASVITTRAGSDDLRGLQV